MAGNSLGYKNFGMTSIGDALKDFLGKNKDEPKSFGKPFPKQETAQVMHIRDYKEDAAVNRELNDKLNSMVEENSSHLLEKMKLHRLVRECIEKEKRRTCVRKIVTMNRHCGQLKRVWGKRGLPVEEKSLQSAASKDAFDMSSLSESLPPNPGDNPTLKKAERLAKEYLSLVEQRRRSYRRSEMLRLLAALASKQNNSSSRSSTQPKSRSFTRMVKKVYGDEKNVRIFSYRPLIKRWKDSVDCVDCKRVSCPELRELHKHKKYETMQYLGGESRLQNRSLQSKDVDYTLGRETIVLLKSSSTPADKTNSVEQKEKNKVDPNTNATNNLQNPERVFNEEQRCEELRRRISQQTKQLHDCILLNRQLSRLKITNSKRGDLSESMDGSETEGTSTDQKDNEQVKASVANRRREVLDRLREYYRTYKQHETEALKKN